MTNQKTKKRGVIILLAVCLIAVATVAYALVTNTLKITGSAVIQGAGWNIHFANQDTGTLVGNSPSNKGTATTDDTNTANTSFMTLAITGVVLSADEDTVTYEVDIVNDGTKNAKISSLSGPAFTYSNLNATTGTADQAAATSNISCNLQYTVGSTNLAVNDTLNAGQVKRVKVVLKYDNTASGVDPTNNVTLGLTWQIAYTEAT